MTRGAVVDGCSLGGLQRCDVGTPPKAQLAEFLRHGQGPEIAGIKNPGAVDFEELTSQAIFRSTLVGPLGPKAIISPSPGPGVFDVVDPMTEESFLVADQG